MNILVIDNFDSFTYNLVHYLEDLDQILKLLDMITLIYSLTQKYTNILISPGPGYINDYPLLFELLQEYYQSKSIFVFA